MVLLALQEPVQLATGTGEALASSPNVYNKYKNEKKDKFIKNRKYWKLH